MMFCTNIARPTWNRPRVVGLCVVAALLGLPLGQVSAAATVAWHADLAGAQRAAQISRRPILAVFTASWTTAASAVDRTALASDEAVALVTACFEPVCVDVDANPDATRRVGVSRVPTACVLMPDGQLVSKFELPGTPAEFVAAAARAAQEAAFATAASQAMPRGVTVEQATAGRTLPGLAAGESAFGGGEGYDTRSTSSPHNRGLSPPGGRAISAVAAKVRMLSDFADTDCPPTVSGDALAASFREASLVTPAANAAPTTAAPAAESTVAAAPAAATTPADHTAFPAQVATPPAAVREAPAATAPAAHGPIESLAGSAAQAPLGVDSAAVGPPPTATAAAPWLGMPADAPTIAAAPATPTSQPPAAATAVATATAPIGAVIEPQPATPEKPADSAASLTQSSPPPATGAAGLLATLQKPFAIFTRPAAPRNAQTQPASGSADATASAPVEPDAYGSMPVGLEGYCPVMLAERGVWVEGRAQWGVRHRGRTYLFAGEQQQKAFLADPDRYAPALSGDDPVLAFDAGKSTPGQRRYGVTYQSRMYLFSSSETRDTFAANPQRYTAGTLVAENRSSTVAAGGSLVR